MLKCAILVGNKGIQRGRTTRTSYSTLTHRGYNFGCVHLFLKVAPIKLGAQHYLIDMLQLGHGELGFEQAESYGFEIDTLAQARLCYAKYLGMIESQGRQLVEGKPACIGSIAPTLHLRNGHEAKECRGYHTATRVAIYSAKSVELLKEIGREMGFFVQFAQRTGFQGLVFVHKTSRQRPGMTEWFHIALNQQYL